MCHEEFLTHKEMDQRGQGKFLFPKDLVIFFQLFEREKLINVIFILPKGNWQELEGLGQDNELMDENMLLMKLNPG
jgi:hypothetical protein